MKGLVLYGAKCNSDIWNPVKDKFAGYDFEYVTYPPEVLSNAQTIDDIAVWAVRTYGAEKYDVLIGHSMGGQVALRMLAGMKTMPGKVILVESNPVPSGVFYRNLMTAPHMEEFGTEIMDMFKKEDKDYNEQLLGTLGDEYDLTDCIRQYDGKVFAIYGDRDCPEYEKRYEELELPQDIMDRLTVKFIAYACHMPMIENPDQFASVVRDIVNEK